MSTITATCIKSVIMDSDDALDGKTAFIEGKDYVMTKSEHFNDYCAVDELNQIHVIYKNLKNDIWFDMHFKIKGAINV